MLACRATDVRPADGSRSGTQYLWVACEYSRYHYDISWAIFFPPPVSTSVGTEGKLTLFMEQVWENEFLSVCLSVHAERTE